MSLKRIRRLITKAAARHVGPEDPSNTTPKTSGRHAAPRSLRRRLIPIVLVAALVVGAAATLTVHGAAATVNVRDTSTNSRATTTPPTASPSPTLAPIGTGVVDPAVKPYVAPKLLSEVPVGPQSVAKPVNTVLQSQTVITALDSSGIPAVALQAYKHAAGVLSITEPGCHLPWELIAGIGRVESDHGQFGGAQLLANGNESKPIYGIPLDGRPGVALVRDTDHGKLDGDPNFDRAVGPLQFIPSTWATDGMDGNGDGVKNPENIFDAALAAANYLCTGGRNMTNLTQEEAAVRSYNDADSYVRVVIATAESYAKGDAATIPFTAPTTSGTASGPSLAGVGQLSGGLQQSQPSPATKASQPSGTAKKPAAKPAPSSHPTQVSKPAAPAPAKSTTSPKPTTKPTTKPTSAPTPSTMPTSAPMPSSTATASPMPTPTRTATPAPKPSGHPRHTQPPRPTHIGHVVNVGWAPAMREVVVKILTTPKAASTHQDRSHNPSHPTPGATDPARVEENRPTARPTAHPTGKK